MTRLSGRLLSMALAGLMLAGGSALAFEDKKPATQQAPKGVEDLPEEDEALKPEKDYSFNPIQAARDVDVGNQYFKKKKYRAAAFRYREATLYNPTLAEAFFRLGEAREKLNDKAAADEAFHKYLELAPDGKLAGEARKRVGKK